MCIDETDYTAAQCKRSKQILVLYIYNINVHYENRWTDEQVYTVYYLCHITAAYASIHDINNALFDFDG